MKNLGQCQRENATVKALLSGRETDEITAHLRSCPNCREAAKIGGFFQTAFPNEPSPVNIPAAGLLWWKSRLRARQNAALKASRPLLIVQIASIATAAAMVIWLWTSDAFGFASSASRMLSSMEAIIVPVILAAIGIVLAGLILILALRRLMPEK
jgi:hypothetical protein